jgi:hypothetical protein
VARFVGVAAFATASPTAYTLPLVAGTSAKPRRFSRSARVPREVSINNQSIHKSGLQQAGYSLQFLPACAEQDHFPSVDVLKINGKRPLIDIARHHLTVGIEKFA